MFAQYCSRGNRTDSYRPFARWFLTASSHGADGGEVIVERVSQLEVGSVCTSLNRHSETFSCRGW